jgi:hypothetical protein
MSDFCPDGYVPSQEAVFIAAKFWFSEKVASLETATTDNPSLHVRSHFAHRPEDFRQAFEEIAGPTVRRLRNFLHQGKLTAYYFTDDGRHSISHRFWATAQAQGVIELGTYWPFGEPTRWYDRRPNHPIFIEQSELDALLVDEAAGNRQFPLARKTELVAAYRRPEIAMLATRKDQREAIKKLTLFKSHRITDRLFREAEKESGKREPGVKRRHDD